MVAAVDNSVHRLSHLLLPALSAKLLLYFCQCLSHHVDVLAGCHSVLIESQPLLHLIREGGQEILTMSKKNYQCPPCCIAES